METRRVCFNCPKEVESEEHVIMDCPVYSDLRSFLFSKLTQHILEFDTKSKHENFICVLSCDDVPVKRISAKICNDILMLRRQLYTSDIIFLLVNSRHKQCKFVPN